MRVKAPGGWIRTVWVVRTDACFQMGLTSKFVSDKGVPPAILEKPTILKLQLIGLREVPEAAESQFHFEHTKIYSHSFNLGFHLIQQKYICHTKRRSAKWTTELKYQIYDFFSFFRMLVCSRAAARLFLWNKHNFHSPTIFTAENGTRTGWANRAKYHFEWFATYIRRQLSCSHNVYRLGNFLRAFGGRFGFHLDGSRQNRRGRRFRSANSGQPSNVWHLKRTTSPKLKDAQNNVSAQFWKEVILKPPHTYPSGSNSFEAMTQSLEFVFTISQGKLQLVQQHNVLSQFVEMRYDVFCWHRVQICKLETRNVLSFFSQQPVVIRNASVVSRKWSLYLFPIRPTLAQLLCFFFDQQTLEASSGKQKGTNANICFDFWVWLLRVSVWMAGNELTLWPRNDTPDCLKSANLIPVGSGVAWKEEQKGCLLPTCSFQRFSGDQYRGQILWMVSLLKSMILTPKSAPLCLCLCSCSFFFVAFLSALRDSMFVSAAVISFCKSCVFFSRSFFLISIFFNSPSKYCSSSICILEIRQFLCATHLPHAGPAGSASHCGEVFQVYNTLNWLMLCMLRYERSYIHCVLRPACPNAHTLKLIQVIVFLAMHRGQRIRTCSGVLLNSLISCSFLIRSCSASNAFILGSEPVGALTWKPEHNSLVGVQRHKNTVETENTLCSAESCNFRQEKDRQPQSFIVGVCHELQSREFTPFHPYSGKTSRFRQ